MGRSYKGFTLVEIMLFLGISALMLGTAFIGTNAVLRTMRFQDSTNSLQAQIQRQYDAVLTGVNFRDPGLICPGSAAAAAPGTSDCILMGRLLHFDGSGSDVTATYNIVGTPPLAPAATLSDEELIFAASPQFLPSTRQQYDMLWGTKLRGAERRNGVPKAIDSVAFVRSPRSSRIVTYVFSRPAALYSLAPQLDPAVGSSSLVSGKATFCLVTDSERGSTAGITINPNSQGQEAISLVDEPDPGDCDGV